MIRLLNSAASTRIRALLCFGMILGLGTVGTLAVWSDYAAATSATFSTGTVDLRVNNVSAYSFDALKLANMLPGESVAATLKVQNRGSIPVKYSTAASTPPGSPALTSFIRVSVHPAGAATNSTVNGIRRGSCSGPMAGSAALIAGGTAPVLSARGPLAGTVGEETLCIVAALSATTRSAVQDQVLGKMTLAFTTTGP